MKFVPEQRGDFWIAVDREIGVELAPFFETRITCEEIGRRTTDEGTYGQYMTNIPLVPIDTPIPRPDHVPALHPRAIRQMLDAGKPASEAFKRNPRNPSR